MLEAKYCSGTPRSATGPVIEVAQRKLTVGHISPHQCLTARLRVAPRPALRHCTGLGARKVPKRRSTASTIISRIISPETPAAVATGDGFAVAAVEREGDACVAGRDRAGGWSRPSAPPAQAFGQARKSYLALGCTLLSTFISINNFLAITRDLVPVV